MFIKFGDQSPVIEIKNAQKTCPECQSPMIMVNGQSSCRCNKKNPHSVDAAIDFIAQTKETTNK